MFVVFVDKEARRCKDVNFLEVEGDGTNGHFLVLPLAVDGIDTGLTSESGALSKFLPALQVAVPV